MNNNLFIHLNQQPIQPHFPIKNIYSRKKIPFSDVFWSNGEIVDPPPLSSCFVIRDVTLFVIHALSHFSLTHTHFHTHTLSRNLHSSILVFRLSPRLAKKPEPGWKLSRDKKQGFLSFSIVFTNCNVWRWLKRMLKH